MVPVNCLMSLNMPMANITPIRELQLLAGLNWTPTSSLTIYSYYGWENAERRDLASSGVAYGYGSDLDYVEMSLPGTSHRQLNLMAKSIRSISSPSGHGGSSFRAGLGICRPVCNIPIQQTHTLAVVP